MLESLPFSFYSRETLLVAQELLGKILCHKVRGIPVGGKIVETEAYLALEDPASHAYRGPTPRSSIMFGQAGRAYVYFIYGNHFCFNVVAHNGSAGAVLVRALEPVCGISQMMKRRGGKDISNLANGPGKLTQALGITKRENGLDLTAGNLVILDPSSGTPSIIKGIVRSPRIGIREARSLLYRFSLKNNSFVSRPWPR